MNIPILLASALLAQAAPAAEAPADGWRVVEHSLTYSEAGAPIYTLDCAGSEVVVTQYGVTSLLDIKKNKPVPDAEGSAPPEGASFMALSTDRIDEPAMIPATAVRNARTGWDMTIRLKKNDLAFKSLPRAKLVSLLTTGVTRAVDVSKDDQTLFGTFVSQCRSGG
jgi:hypothetical protein